MSINSAPVTNPSTLSYSAVLQQPARLPSSSSIKFIPTNKPLVNPDGSFTIFSWKNTRSSLQDKPFVGHVLPTLSPQIAFSLIANPTPFQTKPFSPSSVKSSLELLSFLLKDSFSSHSKINSPMKNISLMAASFLKTRPFISPHLRLSQDNPLSSIYMVFPSVLMMKLLMQFLPLSLSSAILKKLHLY